MKVPNKIIKEIDFSKVRVSKYSVYALYHALEQKLIGCYFKIPIDERRKLYKKKIDFGIIKFDYQKKDVKLDNKKYDKFTTFDIEKIGELKAFELLLKIKLEALIADSFIKIERAALIENDFIIIERKELKKHFGTNSTAKIKTALKRLQTIAGVNFEYIVPYGKDFVVFKKAEKHV